MTILWTGTITDDTGILALVDPAAYQGYISAQWTYEQILARFREAVTLHQLLVWETGLEGIWNVRISTITDNSNNSTSSAELDSTSAAISARGNNANIDTSADNKITPDAPQTFRSARGFLKTSGNLCLVNYETLSMVAQFEDEKVNDTTNTTYCFTLDPGCYSVTIKQLFDPKSPPGSPAAKAIDFDIYLEPASTQGSTTDLTLTTWTEIAWSRP